MLVQSPVRNIKYSSHLSQLARLWLYEPDAAQIERARAVLGLDGAGMTPSDLAAAYTELFLLNVYPYASVYLEADGEMNGTRAQMMERMYEQFNFAPASLRQVGAADHVGLMLQFLDAVGDAPVLPALLDWAPMLCLAIEREPGAHPFYRALARETRQRLFLHARAAGAMKPPNDQTLPLAPDDEYSLRTVVHFFLAPARCGIFLSRAQLGNLARRLGHRLPFGPRVEVAHALFHSSGASGQVDALLNELRVEISEWSRAYSAWMRACAAWQPFATIWLERTAHALAKTDELREILARPLEVEVVR